MNLNKHAAAYLLMGTTLLTIGAAPAFAQVASPIQDPNSKMGPGRVDPEVRASDTLSTSTSALEPSADSKQFNIAVDEFNTGKLPQAAQDLQSVLKQDPDNVPAHKLLGYTYLRQNKYADAAAQLQIVAKKTPKDLPARDNLGVALLQLGRREDAAAQFKAVLALSPKDALASQGLAQSQPHAADAAAPAGQPKGKGDKQSAQQYADQGKALLQAGKTADAADAFSHAADLDPKNADLHLYVGGLYAQAGQGDKAMAAVNQALVLHTTHQFEAHVMLAQLYHATDPAKAIAEFRAAAQARPNEPSVWYNLGVLEAQTGDTANARRDYQKTLDLKPADASLAAQARQNLAALPAGAAK